MHCVEIIVTLSGVVVLSLQTPGRTRLQKLLLAVNGKVEVAISVTPVFKYKISRRHHEPQTTWTDQGNSMGPQLLFGNR